MTVLSGVSSHSKMGLLASLLTAGLALGSTSAATGPDDLGGMSDSPGAEWVEWATSADRSTVNFLNSATVADLGDGRVRYDVLFNMAQAEAVSPRLTETYSSYVITYEAACETGQVRTLLFKMHASRGAVGQPLHKLESPQALWFMHPADSIGEDLMHAACDTIRRESTASKP